MKGAFLLHTAQLTVQYERRVAALSSEQITAGQHASQSQFKQLRPSTTSHKLGRGAAYRL